MITLSITVLILFANGLFRVGLGGQPASLFLALVPLACAYALASKVLWPEYLP